MAPETTPAAPFRPFVRCTRDGDALVCTPWNYGDEGEPVTVRYVFDDVEATASPEWSNYMGTVALVMKVAGLITTTGYYLSNMTTHSDGPRFSATTWNLTRNWS